MHTVIRRLRRARGWTIKELAARVGTSEATVSRLETHQIALSVDWLKRIADAFDVSVSDIIGEDEETGLAFRGVLHPNGALAPAAAPDLPIDIAAPGAALLQLSERSGPFEAGDLILFRETAQADARPGPAVAETAEGVYLGRLLKAGDDDLLFAPEDAARRAAPFEECAWVGTIIMRLSQYDGSEADDSAASLEEALRAREGSA